MKGKLPKVVVVGAIYVDMVVKCDQMPSTESAVAGSSLTYSITGPGPCQAAEAALCGCEVNLIGKVGGDPFAQMVRQSLNEFNVNTDYVIAAEAKTTGANITVVNDMGENNSVTYHGVNLALSPIDIQAADAVIQDADVCLIHGCLPQDTIVAAIRAAKVHGTTVILNPAKPIKSNQVAQNDLLPNEYFNADILIPNLYEAANIIDRSPANLNASKLIGSDLIARGVKTAVITMGKRGCMVIDLNGVDHIPAFDIELVDHTGTGDVFAGALAAYIAVDNDVRKAVKFASAAAAIICTRLGTFEVLPSKAEIIELLQRQDTEEA
jgi:ribokinase